jgi:hypothetical protein
VTVVVVVVVVFTAGCTHRECDVNKLYNYRIHTIVRAHAREAARLPEGRQIIDEKKEIALAVACQL